jgi:energy-coupling factor transport system permease protein
MVTIKNCHPTVAVCYFAAVLGIAAVLQNPLYSLTALAGGLLSGRALREKGGKRLVSWWMIPAFLAAGLLNPLISHRGMTVLFFMGDKPVTLESLCYGIAAAVLLAAVLLWFDGLSSVLRSEKLIYLLGGVFPAAALTLSMALGMIPRIRRKSGEIREAQRGLGIPEGKNPGGRLRNSLRMSGILVTWALENGVDTADSMAARGYGLSRKSHYHPWKFTWADGGLLCVIFLLSLGAAGLAGSFSFYPVLSGGLFGWRKLAGGFCYLILSLLPAILQWGEKLQWRLLQSKI